MGSRTTRSWLTNSQAIREADMKHQIRNAWTETAEWILVGSCVLLPFILLSPIVGLLYPAPLA